MARDPERARRAVDLAGAGGSRSATRRTLRWSIWSSIRRRWAWQAPRRRGPRRSSTPRCSDASQLAVDLVYEPRRTAWLEAAAAQGARTVGGLGMLVHQAALQIERWTGLEAPVEAMWAAVDEEAAELVMAPRLGTSRRRTVGSNDWLLAGAALAAAFVGLVMVYTATRSGLAVRGLSSTYFLKRQAVFVFGGIIVMVPAVALRLPTPRAAGHADLRRAARPARGRARPGRRLERARVRSAGSRSGFIQIQPSEFAVLAHRSSPWPPTATGVPTA